MNERNLTKKREQTLRNGVSPAERAKKDQKYVKAATRDNTRRAYQSVVRRFQRWGGLLPATEKMIIEYLLDHAETLNHRSLALHLSALSQWHKLRGFHDPTASPEVRKRLKGIREEHPAPLRQGKVFDLDDFNVMLDYLYKKDSLKNLRDRALLLVGFFGAFRRSELASINIKDIHWEKDGILITLPKTKTDKTGAGIEKGLPKGNGKLCPITALKKWLEEAAIKEGPIFRRITRSGELGENAIDPGSLNRILKQIAEMAGLDCAADISSHSLRRSFATNAYKKGAPFRAIQRQGAWSGKTVWRYIEEASTLEDNAGKVLFEE